VEFTLVSATEDDRPVLRRLMELYRYDFSQFDRADVDAHGEYGYRYLDHYWTEPHREAFLFQVDGRWAGFGLVRAEEPFDMSEFFVLRKYRRQGIGRTAAAQLLQRFPGPWKVRQQKTNPAATDFWRLAIPYPYTESSTDEEIVQLFDSSFLPKSDGRPVGGAGLTIRPAAGADLADVLALWKAAAAEPTHTDDLAALRALVMHDPGALVVAEAAGTVVGSVIGAWDGWRGSIYRLAVHPEHRGQGIGQRLLAAAETTLERRGCRRAQAIVVEADERAMRFWSSTDWQAQEDRRRFVKG
jgi:predicted acetyltransferase/N-acetylglutamate synthase-like GNAT family acetyltransferase